MTYIVCIVMPPCKDTPLRLEELTVLPDFIGTEKIKQKIEDKGFVIRIPSELGKRIC